MCVYGYVVMPEHVHLLLNEPEGGLLADAIHYLKLSFSKRWGRECVVVPRLAGTERPRTWATGAGTERTPMSAILASQVSSQNPLANLGHPNGATAGTFWQKRYYDRNVRDEHEFVEKLRYLHRNPVKRGLVKEPGDWKWSSFRHYANREVSVVEIESEWTARDREKEKTGGAERVFLIPG